MAGGGCSLPWDKQRPLQFVEDRTVMEVLPRHWLDQCCGDYS